MTFKFDFPPISQLTLLLGEGAKNFVSSLHELIKYWLGYHDLGGVAGDVFYRVDDDTVLTVVGFKYPSPGPDAFFWVGESGSCDVDSINKKSYPLAPGKVGSKLGNVQELHKHGLTYHVYNAYAVNRGLVLRQNAHT